MYDYAEIQKSEDEFDQIIKERDMASAYLTITQAMGPSAQLLSFLNYDHTLGTELGVALESMSVEDQHVLISSKINLEVFDAFALENLADRVRKIGKALQGGGIAGFLLNFLVQDGRLSSLSIAAIVAGTIIRVVTTRLTKTFKFDVFTAMTRHFSEALKTDLLIANGIPNDFEDASWAAFKINIVDKFSNQYAKAYNNDADVHKKNMIAFNDSGWSESRFAAATEWLMDNAKKVVDLEKGYSKKIANIEKYLTIGENINPKTMASISATLGVSMKLFQSSAQLLSEVKHVLENVAHNFEEKAGGTQPTTSTDTAVTPNTNPNPAANPQVNSQTAPVAV